VPASKLREDELRAMPGHVLFGWQYDRDLSLSLYAIPEAKVSPALRAAMETANFKSYAYDELALGDERAQAFARIDAAMGLGEHKEGAAAAIPAADRDCIAPYRILYLEDGEAPVIEAGGFDKRFVAAFSVRRAQ
jgi:hypothetical protein